MNIRRKIDRVFTELGMQYSHSGIAGFEMFDEHDIHAYYRPFKDMTRVVHVQGYPGMSDDKEFQVHARLMDYDKMMSIREQGGVSIGNEHEAVVENFPPFNPGQGIKIPYSEDRLRGLLEESCDLFKTD